MSDILTDVRKLNWLLQESPTGAFSFNEMCKILSEVLDANVYVANRDGKVVGVAYQVESDKNTIIDDETGEEVFPGEYNDEFLKIRETLVNLTGDEILDVFKYDYDTVDKIHMVIPIMGGGQRWGTMILVRYENKYTDEDTVLAEYGATVIGVEMQRRKTEEEQSDARDVAMVRMAVGTLSYSEVEAVRQIFAELDGDEGLLVASKIADKSGITRSVIVNALRKLESAGVIESRSLGMKGTRIKIINRRFKDELEEMQE